MTRSSLFILLLLPFLAIATAIDSSQQVPLTHDSVHIMDGWDWEDCGVESDLVQIDSISVTPDPPKPGQDMTVTVVGSTSVEIEYGAIADVTVKMGLIKLLKKTFDICDEARNANASVQCPVQPGKYTVEQTVSLPKEIPPAKFIVDVQGYTADEENLLCLKLHVDFTRRFPRIW
ncbi:ML domain-containing protein [Cyathus striatus]|nr:ML domain-containing protein [Cyathus striatus]